MPAKTAIIHDVVNQREQREFGLVPVVEYDPQLQSQRVREQELLPRSALIINGFSSLFARPQAAARLAARGDYLADCSQIGHEPQLNVF